MDIINHIALSQNIVDEMNASLDQREHYFTVYKNSPIEFIERFIWTYDPKGEMGRQTIPFILFPKQKEYINWLTDKYLGKEPGYVLKCRDVGMTWLNCAFAVWLWLFHGQVVISFLSRTRDYVDRLSDMDAILPKIRFAIENLPTIFLPRGFNPVKHMGYMRILNPETGALIKGLSGDNAGRGGRATITFVDECGFIPRMERVEAAISQNSNVRIYGSTYNGIGGFFYDKINVYGNDPFIINWFDDPRKDQAWFDKQQQELDPITFAQEVLCDPGASIENICIPMKYIMATVGLKLPGMEDGSIFAGLDVSDGLSDTNDSNAYIRRNGITVKTIKEWKGEDTTQTARKTAHLCIEDNVEILYYDTVGVGAGIKGEANRLAREAGLKVNMVGVNVGESPSDGSTGSKKNKDMFLNLKAQLWWQARLRFEKTYEHVNGIKEHPVEEMICLSDEPDLINKLIRQLGQPKYEKADNGLIKIESKKALKKRGIKSPDLAEAFILSFANTGKMPSIRTFDAPRHEKKKRTPAEIEQLKNHRNPYVRRTS